MTSSDWIACEVRLPTKADTVLVAYNAPWKPSRRKHWSVHQAKYSGGAWRFINARDDGRKSERVRFWMPMPKAPR